MKSSRIGIDFDNTIICYDLLFYNLAIKMYSMDAAVMPTKQAVRDALRSQPGGETHWQKLQATVYGPRIYDAQPFPGIHNFLKIGLQTGATFFIVSHKSRFAAQDTELRHNLVTMANTWLFRHEIAGIGMPIHPDHVYFEPSRQEKLARIANLRCDIFIDDLPDIFLATAFPAMTTPILFGYQEYSTEGLERITPFASWDTITKMFFYHV